MVVPKVEVVVSMYVCMFDLEEWWNACKYMCAVVPCVV